METIGLEGKLLMQRWVVVQLAHLLRLSVVAE